MKLNLGALALLCLVWAFFLGLVGFDLNSAPTILLIIGTLLYLVAHQPLTTRSE